MDQEEIILFSDLPEDIILVEILSRIPIKSVCTCKCVCKSWLKLLETPEFTRSHLSKSVSTFLVHRGTEGKAMLEISEVEEGDLNEPTLKRLTELNITKKILHQKKALWTNIEGSTNGLVFFRTRSPTAQHYYVCNPVTRECIELPTPPPPLEEEAGVVVTHGFGISRSGKYKVVRISQQDRLFACQVYTLGSPSWRSIAITQDLKYGGKFSKGTFLEGNLHWVVSDLNDEEGSRWWVSCFDLETEVFAKFPTRPTATDAFQRVGVLRGCLCLYESSYEIREFVTYLMSCYEKKSWDEEFVIRKIGPAGPARLG